MKTLLAKNAPPKLRSDGLLTLAYMVAWFALFCVPVWLASHHGGPVPIVLAIAVAAAALIHGTHRLYFARCPTCGSPMQFRRQIYVVETAPGSGGSCWREPWGVMTCAGCESVWRVPSIDAGTEPDNLVSEEDFAEICRQNLRVSAAGLIEPSDTAGSR